MRIEYTETGDSIILAPTASLELRVHLLELASRACAEVAFAPGSKCELRTSNSKTSHDIQISIPWVSIACVGTV